MYLTPPTKSRALGHRAQKGDLKSTTHCLQHGFEGSSIRQAGPHPNQHEGSVRQRKGTREVPIVSEVAGIAYCLGHTQIDRMDADRAILRSRPARCSWLVRTAEPVHAPRPEARRSWRH